MRSESSLQRILRNSGWLLGGQLAASGVSFLHNLVVAWALGPGRYGVLALVLAFTSFVDLLFNSRIWETLIKYVPHYRVRGQLRRARATVTVCYGLEAVTALVVGILLWITAPLAARVLVDGDPAAADLFRLFALQPISSFTDEASSGILRIVDRFRWLSYQRVGVAAAKLAIVLALLPGGLSVREVLLAHLAAGVLGAVVLLALALASLRRLGLFEARAYGPRALWRQLRTLLPFTFFTNLSATSRAVTGKADVLLLGALATPAAAGIYELAKRITDQLTGLSNPLYASVYPEISELVAQGARDRLAKLQKQITRLVLLSVLPFCALVDVAAIWLVPALYGEAYQAAVLPLQVMVWRLVWLPFVWFPGYLLAIGRARLAALLNWVDAAAFLVLLAALVPSLEALGAAVASVLRTLLWLAIVARVLSSLERGAAESRTAPSG